MVITTTSASSCTAASPVRSPTRVEPSRSCSSSFFWLDNAYAPPPRPVMHPRARHFTSQVSAGAAGETRPSRALECHPLSQPSCTLSVFCIQSQARWKVGLEGFGFRQFRAAERGHPTGRERMGSPALQTHQDPILLLPWLCFRCDGFPNPSRVSP